MNKILSIIIALFVLTSVEAQIVYETVITENFETTDGFPSDFMVKAQQAWLTVNATNNPNPYTGTIWRDMFSDVKPAAKKTYVTTIVAENRTGGTGTQCLKFDIKNETFTDGETPSLPERTLRLRGQDGKISFNTAAGESITKYEVSFWARTDGDDKQVVMNTKNPNTFLTLTSNWQKFTIDRFTTGTSSTALSIDFFPTVFPAVDNTTGYTVYIDELTVKVRKIATTTAATEISATGFKANWTAVEGADSYSLIVEKSDGATPAVWTAIAGSPFNAGNATTLSVSNLESGTYRYRATATDGTTTTIESNNTFVTTLANGVDEIMFESVYSQDNSIYIHLNTNNKVDVFTLNGQLRLSKECQAGMNQLNIGQKGIYILKSGNDVRKVVL
jgi:hypothetical protein